MEKRIIKFRAWDKLNNEMTYFSLFERPTACYGKEIEIMQFTGLLDKNGKEIYEGDILQCEDLVTIMEWDDERSGYILSQDQPKKGRSISLNVVTISEIIGNIYQNPELLQK